MEERAQLSQVLAPAVIRCLSDFRRSLVVEGVLSVYATVHESGDMRLLLASENLTRSVGESLFSCLDVEALEATNPSGSCFTTSLFYALSTDIELYGRFSMAGDGERGDWVFGTPPSRALPFEVDALRGLATHADAAEVAAAAFGSAFETCFADAVYSNHAGESHFDLDAPVHLACGLRAGTAPEVRVLGSPSHGMNACLLELPWPIMDVDAEADGGRFELRVHPRQTLHAELVAAIERSQRNR